MSLADKLKGMAVFGFGVCLYSLSAVLIKIQMQAYDITAQELLYWISLFVLLCFYLSARAHHQDILSIPSNMQFPLFMRVLLGFTSDVFLFLAFMYTSYSKAICIFFTNPLMIPLFAKCMLNEPVLKVDILAIVIGFVGMLMIAQPFKQIESSDEDSIKEQRFETEMFGMTLALIAAVTGAITVVYVR